MTTPPLPVASTSARSVLWAILDTVADAELGREAALLEWIQNADASTLQALRNQADATDGGSCLRVVEGVGYLPMTGVFRRDPPWWASLLGMETRLTTDYEAAVRTAIEDDGVHTLLSHVRSPGGQTGYVPELADAVWEARRAGMRTVCYFDDCGASAAYWVGSQHEEIYCNAAAMLGAIGTFATVYDTSEQAARHGVKVHVVKSADLKGGAVSGAPVSPEALAEFQRLVTSTNALFVDAVARGRGVDRERVESWADARVHVGREAVDLGLADRVLSLRSLWPALLERRAVADGEASTGTRADVAAQLPLDVNGETVHVSARALASPRADATHWASHPETGDPVFFAVRDASTDSEPPAESSSAETVTDEALSELVSQIFETVLAERTGAF